MYFEMIYIVDFVLKNFQNSVPYQEPGSVLPYMVIPGFPASHWTKPLSLSALIGPHPEELNTAGFLRKHKIREDKKISPIAKLEAIFCAFLLVNYSGSCEAVLETNLSPKAFPWSLCGCTSV